MGSLYMDLFGSAQSLTDELKRLEDPKELARLEAIIDEDLKDLGWI